MSRSNISVTVEIVEIRHRCWGSAQSSVSWLFNKELTKSIPSESSVLIQSSISNQQQPCPATSAAELLHRAVLPFHLFVLLLHLFVLLLRRIVLLLHRIVLLLKLILLLLVTLWLHHHRPATFKHHRRKPNRTRGSLLAFIHWGLLLLELHRQTANLFVQAIPTFSVISLVPMMEQWSFTSSFL